MNRKNRKKKERKRHEGFFSVLIDLISDVVDVILDIFT